MPRLHKVGHTDELDDESRIITDVDGIEIAIFEFDEEYHAVANHCIHQGGPLCEGELRGRTVGADDGWGWNYEASEKHITCPWHAWQFDITTGDCTDSDRYAVPTFELEVRDGDIYVEL